MSATVMDSYETSVAGITVGMTTTVTAATAAKTTETTP
jgi:hypothetical protein